MAKQKSTTGTTDVAKITYTDKTYLAKGKRGIAYTAKCDGKTILIKEKNPDSAVNTLQNEARILQIVNKKNIGPTFIACNDEQLIREFIDGPEVMDWMKTATKPQIKKCLLDIVHQCRDMDLLGVNKLEMTHPHKHILIAKGKPVMIDFDRSKIVERPKNITQVLQWITNKEMEEQLTKKEIMLPREVLLAHAKQYKQTYSKVIYEHIIENIENS
jgi:predicted Ser/Thr protein kinase